MTKAIPGLHHVTAIAGPPQANLDFYVGRLGQRLVKRTVNFDAPDTYHLYYGDRVGSPGTIMTFFPFADAGPGRSGPGMASAVAYRMPEGGIDRWIERLAPDVDVKEPETRFGERTVTISDPDGLAVELIETGAADGDFDGFHSVTLCLEQPERTARLLADVMGFEDGGEEADGTGSRLRMQVPGAALGTIVDLVRDSGAASARKGAGTIHHIAFRAECDDIQKEWRARLVDAGFDVTPVIDRQYFNAIYFREPGGVLFEIATDPPGFAVDEAEPELGSSLMLPPQYESSRAKIEHVLPSIEVPA